MTTTELTFFCLVDSVGDFAVGKSEEDARNQYEADIQPLADCDGFRLLAFAVTTPLPEQVPVSVVIPAIEGKVAVKVEG